VRYAEALVAAGCWREAEDLALQAAASLPGGPEGVSLTDEDGPRLISADRLWRHELAGFLAGAQPGAGTPAAPEAHAARAQDAGGGGGMGSGVATSAGAQASGPHPDDFEDPTPPEPPEVAELLDAALADGAPGRILAARWLE
jgi:hypothetical protein